MRFSIFAMAICFMTVSAFGQPVAEPELPRVLILGDAVYSQNARNVTSELKGKAEVVIASWNAGTLPNSENALNQLDRLLGHLDRNGQPLPADQRPSWDMIHVNVGLGDLIYQAPNMKSFRVMPIHVGGIRTTSPADYENNLNKLIERLQETDAKIVWASTTPIRASQSNVFVVGSEVEYNKIAERVMDKHGIRINDMHTYAKSIMNMDKPASHGADPFSFDRKPLHPPLVKLILDEFEIE